MISLLILSTAMAQDDVHAVEEGDTAEVVGPAVWMSGDRYRDYVADSRLLVSCEEKLDTAIDEGIAANERALKARDVAKAEFRLADEEDEQQVQLIAEQAVRIDTQADTIVRLRQQRNIAWGIAGGFLAASTAAVVLSLD